MTALEVTDIIGIISFALSGFLIAVHHKLDILGIIITAFLTALGGGIIRDVLANKSPFIFTNYLPVSLVLGTVIIAIIFKLHKITDLESKTTFVVSDTVGLVSFSISGSLLAIDVGFNFIGILLLAIITAIGGGTLRDIMVNRVPAFLTSDFYASTAIVIACMISFLDYIGMINFLSLLSTFTFAFFLRLTAHFQKWKLPKLS
ncbi:MAG: trimeric intracellular cation channel family protein [Campylobacteraceae bacterium]|nr:trimeric intracellular cation channel family protein [Campylobacteraceae bacterium]